jgi:hypothetical protein
MRTHVYISLSGERFSPAEAERVTGLVLLDKREPGHIGRYGRYRGKPVPYGAASLDAPKRIPPSEKLTWVLDLALPHIETLRALGVDQAEVWILEHFGSQINMAYRPEELEKLARLGLPLCVSGYETEQRFDRLEGDEPES